MGKYVRTIRQEKGQYSLYECTDGFYFWDETIGMNIVMHEKTEQDALLHAIRYYRQNLMELKASHEILRNKVEGFLAQFPRDDDEF